jgi:2'-5' RNA ligase
VRVRQVSCAAEAPGSWKIGWEVANASGETLAIHSGRLPHGRFRSEERSFSPPLRLGPDRTAVVEFPVEARGAPGSIVENAFLILLASWRDQTWRIFIRFRVVFGPRGEPRSIPEAISSNRAGFAD